ncbi:MAG TPA: hypothetical protein VKG23_07745, partial [Thermoanaerobaculia bacterium]|nr:hypothetical protein [Thermoanaerobaculia bacterium]
AAEPSPTEKPPEWEFNASIYGYFPPNDVHYAQPTVTADRGALHLEARYNYEALKSGSAWVGWNVGTGDALKLDATLMVGGVVGDLRGVAPGYELTLTWKAFELYSESEFVIDTSDSDHFFYTWNQLGWSPWDWLSVGLVAQRTRAYQTGLDVQRGVFVGFTWKSLSLNVYVFNPGWETPTVVTSLAVSF